jgi:hypothetical protein
MLLFKLNVKMMISLHVTIAVLLLEGLIGCSEYNDYHNCTR